MQVLFQVIEALSGEPPYTGNPGQALEYDPEWFHASALNPYQQPQVVMGSA